MSISELSGRLVDALPVPIIRAKLNSSMKTILPVPNALILVAVITTPRDLEIARILGWYRIPLRSAPKVIAVDFIAFYQTAAFGEEKWCIRYVAPVKGHELTTRIELLRDEPDHPSANQEYYKVQIGPLVRLPQPILAEKWRRVTFLYTTGEYLLKAHRVNDLVVDSEERRLLWQALRERASQAQRYNTMDFTDMDIDLTPQILAAFLGIQELETQYLSEKQPGDEGGTLIHDESS
jgi:hypothetical protein